MKDKKGAVYVPIYLEWLDTTQDLTPEEKGNLIDAVICYASGQEYEHLLTGGTKIAFRFLKGQVDRNREISEKRSAAGSITDQNGSNEIKKDQNGSNEIKTEQIGTKLPKEKEKEKEKKEEKEKQRENQERFDRFWSAYPRKENKPAARRAFDKLKVDDGLLRTMLEAIEKQKGTAQWQEDGGHFIPHPATWLNGNRWEDVVQRGSPGKTVVAQNYSQRDYGDEDEEAFRRMLEMEGV